MRAISGMVPAKTVIPRNSHFSWNFHYPKAFMQGYPDADFNVITPANVHEFLL